MTDALSNRKDVAILLLRDKILEQIKENGDYPTLIESFSLSRRDKVNQAENCFYTPLVSITVQGFKDSIIGSEIHHYGMGDCLIAGVDIPSINYVTDATHQHPFLAATLTLNPKLITQLMAETPTANQSDKKLFKSIRVSKADPLILDAFLRLTELLDNPKQISILAPLIIKEIHFRLLTGPHGEALRALYTLGSQSNQIMRSIAWLRMNFNETFLVKKLAAMANMAPSTFHRHFKEITTMSPVQYQKRLRLHEAQRLMLLENIDATSASLTVGYESVTQFNREYKRQFGAPPHHDVKQIRRSLSPQIKQ